MKRKFSTHHAQQKPRAYATLSITTQLFGAVLFIWDIVSDILVITQLAAARAFGPMSLGIIFMSVASMKRQLSLRPSAPHLLHCTARTGFCLTSLLVLSSATRLRLHSALRAMVCTSLVLCEYLWQSQLALIPCFLCAAGLQGCCTSPHCSRFLLPPLLYESPVLPEVCDPGSPHFQNVLAAGNHLRDRAGRDERGISRRGVL